MRFAPEDILTKTFSRNTFGGYNSSEVAIFLEAVAEELEDKQKETQKLTDQLQQRDLSLREFRDREEMLRNTITAAQQMAEKIKQDATKEARFIVEDAKQKADIIVQDARDSLKTAYQDLSDLKRIHIQLKNTLKAVLQSHQDLLNQDPIHSILPDSFQTKESESLMEKKMSESLSQAVQSKDHL